jgi:hypothetical protein
MRKLLWCNEQTRQAYFDAIESIADPLGFAQQWLEMAGDDAQELLARQLAKDAKEWCRQAGRDYLEHALIKAGLRRVYWEDVAERILERARTEHADRGEEPPSWGGSGDAKIPS